MPVKGYRWDDEYREKYYSCPKVQYHLDVFREMAKQPKSEESKLKMSNAKKDVPKTESQKLKMASTQRRRHELYREIIAQEPTLSKDSIWTKVKAIMKHERA